MKEITKSFPAGSVILYQLKIQSSNSPDVIDVPITMKVATGCHVSIIPRNLLKGRDVKEIAKVKVSGLPYYIGIEDFTAVIVGDLIIGNKRFVNMPLFMANVDASRGFLGMDLLQYFDIELIFAENSMGLKYIGDEAARNVEWGSDWRELYENLLITDI